MLRIFDARGFSSASTLFRLSTHLDIPYRQESEKYLLLKKVPSQPRAKSREQPRVFAKRRHQTSSGRPTELEQFCLSPHSANSEGKEPHSAGEKADKSFQQIGMSLLPTNSSVSQHQNHRWLLQGSCSLTSPGYRHQLVCAQEGVLISIQIIQKILPWITYFTL